MAHVPLSLEVHRDVRIEVVLGHIPDHALTQVSGDVDHDIDLAELIHALLYHQPRFEVVGDGGIVCRSFAAGFPDLCNDIIGWRSSVFSPPRPTPGSLTMTLTPSAANVFVTSRPIPRPAPV